MNNNLINNKQNYSVSIIFLIEEKKERIFSLYFRSDPDPLFPNPNPRIRIQIKMIKIHTLAEKASITVYTRCRNR